MDSGNLSINVESKAVQEHIPTCSKQRDTPFKYVNCIWWRPCQYIRSGWLNTKGSILCGARTVLSASWRLLPASQLPAGHRQSFHSHRSLASRTRTQSGSMVQSSLLTSPCSHGCPRLQGLFCLTEMERVALKYAQPSAFCPFIWGTLGSSSPLKQRGLEKEQQIRGFSHIKNPKYRRQNF